MKTDALMGLFGDARRDPCGIAKAILMPNPDTLRIRGRPRPRRNHKGRRLVGYARGRSITPIALSLSTRVICHQIYP